MAERLSARLARISTDAEYAANVAAMHRERFAHGPMEGWEMWDKLYGWVDCIEADADAAVRFLREHPDYDMEV